MEKEILRLSAEQLYKNEIDALIKNETNPIPKGWQMSPKSVLTYILGGKSGGTTITPKYMGDRKVVEICIATLVTDRALLLIGEPGTAKSWLSEHLTAAINGNSSQVIQGTAGTTEEHIRYSWNYAMLLAKGPSFESLVKSPIYNARKFHDVQAKFRTHLSRYFRKREYRYLNFQRKWLRKRDFQLSQLPTHATRA